MSMSFEQWWEPRKDELDLPTRDAREAWEAAQAAALWNHRKKSRAK